MVALSTGSMSKHYDPVHVGLDDEGNGTFERTPHAGKENPELCGTMTDGGKEKPELCETEADPGKEIRELCAVRPSAGKVFFELCAAWASPGKENAEL